MAQRACFKLITVALLLLVARPSVSDDSKTSIEIGIAPFLSVYTLVQNYAPLVKHLESRLKIPVSIVSAPDYKTFYERIRKRAYPFIITPANSAYLAWSESSYVPMLKPLIHSRPVVVVTNNSNFSRLDDLRNKTISMSDPLAMTSMQGMQQLQEAGLLQGRDITIINMPNHSVAVNLLLAGEVSAAIVSDRAILQMPAAIKEKIKVVYTWDKSADPGVIYLANPNLSKKLREQISAAIYDYYKNTPDGIEQINEMGYGGLVTVTSGELKHLAPYGELLKKALAKM